MSDRFPRGMYRDRTNGDLWAQLAASSGERWSWINGEGWVTVPRYNLDRIDDLPDWY